MSFPNVKLGEKDHNWNPSTQGTEIGGLPEAQGNPELQSKISFQQSKPSNYKYLSEKLYKMHLPRGYLSLPALNII